MAGSGSNRLIICVKLFCVAPKSNYITTCSHSALNVQRRYLRSIKNDKDSVKHHLDSTSAKLLYSARDSLK